MKKGILKWGLSLAGIGLLIATGIVFYLYNMPHRDVQAARVDYKMESRELVKEYLNNPDQANQKYLQENGESKILLVTGIIQTITEDLNKQKVVLLKDEGEKAGVSCTFTNATNANAHTLKIGTQATIKGVIRSGAGYDEDLELYEDVVLEKCDVFNPQAKQLK